MSQFLPTEPTPNPADAMTLEDVAEVADGHGLPPGGLLDLDDALAEALAAVEAVEAKHAYDIAHVSQVLPADSPPDDALPPELAQRPEIRGMPTIGSADARSQLGDQVRDLTLKLVDARHKQERDLKEIEQLMADLSVTRRRYHKLGAEHDELRKRLQRAELDLPDQGARSVLNALLAPLDHLHDVLDHLCAREPLSAEAREAIAMLQGQWQRAFGVLQVTPFDAVGQPYDAQLHEYIASAPSTAPPGQVIRQVGRGYLLSGRLLRSARVVVSAGLHTSSLVIADADPTEPDGPSQDDPAIQG